jgi:hypothetical protein
VGISDLGRAGELPARLIGLATRLQTKPEHESRHRGGFLPARPLRGRQRRLEERLAALGHAGGQVHARCRDKGVRAKDKRAAGWRADLCEELFRTIGERARLVS